MHHLPSAGRTSRPCWRSAGPGTPRRPSSPFSLPTEDEWEYLCSGGVHQLFPWGDSLDLDAIGREDIDKDGKNAFGLVIGNDCRAEQVEGTHILKGDDGGIYLGGGDVELAALPYSPYFRYVHPYYWRSVPSGEPPAFHHAAGAPPALRAGSGDRPLNRYPARPDPQTRVFRTLRPNEEERKHIWLS